MSDEPVILEMFGDPDAAQCIDGICRVPVADPAPTMKSVPLHDDDDELLSLPGEDRDVDI